MTRPLTKTEWRGVFFDCTVALLRQNGSVIGPLVSLLWMALTCWLTITQSISLQDPEHVFIAKVGKALEILDQQSPGL